MDSVRAVLLLVFALASALLGAAARRNGLYFFSIVLSVLALVVVVVVAAGFLPRLVQRIRQEYWGGMRFLRVTRRGILFLLLVLLIALSTFNTGNNLLVLVLSFLLAALLVSGMASNLTLYGLRISLALPDSIHAGQTAAALVTLYNEKRWFPSFSLTLRNAAAGPEHIESTDFFEQRKLFPYLPPKSSRTEKLECRFLKRGVYPLRGFQVHTSFPFGFVARGREVPAEGKITVYPALMDVRGLVRSYAFLQGSEPRNRRGLGTGLYNVRDYRRGDSARFVHWKATAKLSSLMVKEFLEECDDTLQLVLSTYLPGPDSHRLEQFEKALSCVASLACAYRAEGKTFRFYSGEFETVVNREREGIEGLLEYLAWVKPAERLLIEPRKLMAGAILFVAGNTFAEETLPRVDYLRL